jgi:hypothetical protein
VVFDGVTVPVPVIDADFEGVTVPEPVCVGDCVAVCVDDCVLVIDVVPDIVCVTVFETVWILVGVPV